MTQPKIKAIRPKSLEEIKTEIDAVRTKHKLLISQALVLNRQLRRLITSQKNAEEKVKREADIAEAFKLADMCRKNGYNTIIELNLAIQKLKHAPYSSSTPPLPPQNK